jgi:hypothetical protein
VFKYVLSFNQADLYLVEIVLFCRYKYCTFNLVVYHVTIPGSYIPLMQVQSLTNTIIVMDDHKV